MSGATLLASEEAPKAVIAYVFVSNRVLSPDEIAASKLTRINYAFANLKDGEMVEGFAHDGENFAVLSGLKQINPNLKILVSVGGWTWSGGFSDMALTALTRKKFIDSAVSFIDRYKLDGLDVDWEYPGLPGIGNPFRPVDRSNYTALLRELRIRFNLEEKRLKRKLLLSIATGASVSFLEQTEMRQVAAQVDSVNLMSYDYYESSSSALTGHHSPLHANPADVQLVSAENSVKLYLQAGVPPGKLVLGVPFYGHAWSDVGKTAHGLFQPGKPASLDASYRNIVGTMLHSGYMRYWDPIASAPYLYNPAARTFVSYEDVESVSLKARFVMQQHLGGMMFWEYHSDADGALLDAIDAGLHIRLKPRAGALTPLFSTRVVSIDVFRGLTMLLMIFVNDLAGVQNLPWWNYHMPGSADGMTYVDMVFPAFLFILGMTIPLAVEARLAKSDSYAKLWWHVLGRSLGLVVLGIALANVGKGDPRLMGISTNGWGLLFLLAAVLFWNVYPNGGGARRWYRILPLLGFLTMAALLAIFRRSTAAGHVRWLDFSYWEILGIIGWTYLGVCLLYIPARRWHWSPVAWLAALCALNVLCTAGAIPFVDELPFYVWPWSNGTFVMIAMAGIVTTEIFLTEPVEKWAAKEFRGVAFGLLLLGAGFLLTPLGISKNRATPTWGLYSAGASVLIFGVLYWVCDVRRHLCWAGFTRAPGRNTLLTYLLPDIFYFSVGTAWIPVVFQRRWPGAVRSLLFTCAIAATAALLTRFRIRLHL